MRELWIFERISISFSAEVVVVLVLRFVVMKLEFVVFLTAAMSLPLSRTAL